jgi:hypothetical protein
MIRILEALDSNLGRRQALLNFSVAFLCPRKQILELQCYPIHNGHRALLSSNDIYPLIIIIIIIEKTILFEP